LSLKSELAVSYNIYKSNKEGLVKNPVVFSLILLVLSACSNSMESTSAVVPTPVFMVTPLIAASPIPTNTSLPPTETPDVVSSLVPQGQPVSEWNGIPIMPEAIAGEGDDESYVFTIKATPQQVREYYQLELGKLGWQASAIGNGDSSVMLMFVNNASATLTVSIIAKRDEALVLLVK